jgi:hypothetical protein
MPIMIIIRASKVTPQIYEAIRNAVGWDKVPAVGAISHSISFTEKGAVEVNIWESKALYDEYVETRLKPVIEKLGIVLDEVEVTETGVFVVGPPALGYMLPTLARPEPVPKGRVIAIFRRSNIPAALYDSFRARAPIDTVPRGALAHAYGRAGDDILSVDVWDDAEEMMKFIEDAVIPAARAEGLDFHWPEIVPLQTFITAPAAKAHERPYTRTLASALASAE